MRHIATIIAAVLYFSSASHSAAEPPILFLKTRVNYAWGYAYQGFFIDAAGAVFTYSFSKDDSIPYYSEAEPVPDKLLAGLLEKGIPTGRGIASDTLEQMYRLADSAASGALSSDYMCADFGILRYGMFRYDSTSEKTREIICIQMGDEAVCNASPAAKTVARWMLTAIDSVDLSTRLSCSPDSCLLVTTAVALPLPVQPAQRSNHSPALQFHLNGKKAEGASRSLTVGSIGKKPIRFTTEAKK